MTAVQRNPIVSESFYFNYNWQFGRWPRVMAVRYQVQYLEPGRYKVYRLDLGRWDGRIDPAKIAKQNTDHSVAGAIYWVNQSTRQYKTYADSRGDEVDDPLPEGMHVYRSPKAAQDLLAAGLRDIRELFREEISPRSKHEAFLDYTRGHIPKKIILFYTGDRSKPQPTYRDIMKQLNRRKPALAELVRIYCDHFLFMMDGTPADLDRMAFSIVQYEPGEGLFPHIDGIATLGHSAGPIFTVAMGYSKEQWAKDKSRKVLEEGEKGLDMIPVIAESDARPIRVITRQGDIVVLDGKARLEWSHAVPYGTDSMMFTLAFKFRQILPLNQKPVGYSDVLGTEIFDNIIH